MFTGFQVKKWLGELIWGYRMDWQDLLYIARAWQVNQAGQRGQLEP